MGFMICEQHGLVHRFFFTNIHFSYAYATNDEVILELIKMKRFSNKF